MNGIALAVSIMIVLQVYTLYKVSQRIEINLMVKEDERPENQD